MGSKENIERHMNTKEDSKTIEDIIESFIDRGRYVPYEFAVAMVAEDKVIEELKDHESQAVLKAQIEVLKKVLELGEKRDLEANAYSFETPGVLRTSNAPIYIHPYKSTIKEFIIQLEAEKGKNV